MKNFDSIYDLEEHTFSEFFDDLTMNFHGCANKPGTSVSMNRRQTLLLISCKAMRTPHPKLVKYKIRDNKFKRIPLDSEDMVDFEQKRKEYQNS